MRSRSIIAFAIIFVLAISSLSLLSQAIPGKSFQVSLAAGRNEKPTTTFPSDVATIYVFWKGDRFEIGDKIKASWIAEDVDDGGSKHTKIREGEVRVYKHQEGGEFSLSRPPGQTWPPGKYAVEFYVNDNLTQIVKFTIQPAAKIEVH